MLDTRYGYKIRYGRTLSPHGKFTPWDFLIIPALVLILYAYFLIRAKKAKEAAAEQYRIEKERKRREWEEFKKKDKAQRAETRKIVRKAQQSWINGMVAKGAAKGEAWHKAMDQAQEEFKEKGITDLSYQNADLIKRADEIYESGIYADVEKASYSKQLQKQEEMEKDMAEKVLLGKTYGGYTFTLAQMETVDGLPEETCEKIGKIITESLAAHKRKYQIKQDLFMSILNWDAEFFVELVRVKSFLEEKDIIFSFYHEHKNWWFKSEQEIHNFYDSSKYLNFHPRLKEEVIKDAIWCLKENEEATDKYIMIRKGKRVKAIEKGEPIPEGWEISL
ncbi:MAG: hypothetical protein LBQ88_12010 [Treponema sp.]|nr:hypothetical protein [Treponema sp.]